MYVCLEGLDGSGKTTLFNGLKIKFDEHCKLHGLTAEIACPTHNSNPDSLLEKLYNRNSRLKNSSLFRAFIYSRRSNFVAKNTNWNSDFVLGDRSIVTSYVTRWRKYRGSAKLSSLFVDIMESKIPAPDFVIMLDASPELLIRRLKARNKEIDIDETPKRSMEMRAAYKEIRDSALISRLGKAHWVTVPIYDEDEPVDVLDRTWKILEENVLQLSLKE
jgi:thymidylate kinase